VSATRFGIVALIGRPNAGKSTLLNRILGQKVSIVSAKPQTTRNRIVGIHTEERGQLAFLDTPGIHKPLHRLNVRMMDHVRSALAEADVITLIVDASEAFGKGDQYVVDLISSTRRENPAAKRILLLNKIDRVRKHLLLPMMERYSGLGLFDEIVPISASSGDGVEHLLDLLFGAVPEGPPRYPVEDFTTQPERFLAAELVREKVLEQTADELPYTTAVSVDRFEEEESDPSSGRRSGLIRIWATVFVERESQKGIVVGRQGSRIKRIGTDARVELETILGAKVYLDLRVAVHEGWREDERFLGELEYPLE
jgi:GTP-binding protein Era